MATSFGKPGGVFRLTRDNWWELMGARPARDLWGVGARTAAKLADHGIVTIADLGHADEQDLADRFGRPATDGILVAHELTQEELAQLVGASRETVNKALAEFVQRGWIRLEARAVVILDTPRLQQRSR